MNNQLRDMYRASHTADETSEIAYYEGLAEMEREAYAAQQADPLRATCFSQDRVRDCDEETDVPF